MKRVSQKQIACAADISRSLLSMILSGKRRPRWPKAKRLESVTGISAIDWIEKPSDELKSALENVTLKDDDGDACGMVKE